MKRIPAELFISIISYLRLSDKLACILVCKQWYGTITGANLYDTLAIKSSDTLKQALDFFNQNPNMGKQVHHIRIEKMDIDHQTLLSLPILFPDIISLNWMEKGNHHFKYTDHPPEYEYKEALKKWKNLKKVIDDGESLHITTTLLGSGKTFTNLRYLEVMFIGFEELDNNRNTVPTRFRINKLLQQIHNAPYLECLILKYTNIQLADLETLHNSLPKLQELKIEEGSLQNNEGANVVVEAPAKYIKSFSAIFVPADTTDTQHSDGGFPQTIANWITYMGQKYINLQDLDVSLGEYCYQEAYDFSIIEEPLSLALRNFEHLKSYIIDFYTLNENVVNVMDNSNIHLKRLKLRWESAPNYLMLQSLFECLNSSNLASAVETLELDTSIVISATTYSALFRNFLLQVSTRWDNLRQVVVQTGGPSLLLNILKSLTNIETLKFNLTSYKISKDESNIMYGKLFRLRNIRNLDIHLDIESEKEALVQLNCIFDFVLESCLLLEHLKLSGKFDFTPGVLDLSFENHNYLRRISIENYGGCIYYAVNQGLLQGAEQWKSLNYGNQNIEVDAKQTQLLCDDFHIRLYLKKGQEKNVYWEEECD